MQAHPRRTVGGEGLERAHHRALADRVADRHPGGDRLVRRAGVAVADDDDAAAGQHAGEGHRARQRRAHRLTRVAEEIDPPMPRAVRRSRRIEARDDLRLGARAATRRPDRRCPHRETRPAARGRSPGAALGAVGSPVAWPDPLAEVSRSPRSALPGCGRPRRPRLLWTLCGPPAIGRTRRADGYSERTGSRTVREGCPGAGIRTSADHDGAHSERRPPVGDGSQSRAIGSGRTQASGPN